MFPKGNCQNFYVEVPMNRCRDKDSVRAAISRPVPSVNPVFTKKGDIDWKKTEDLIDFMIQNGAKALLLTFGDSNLSLLSEKEVLEFNRRFVSVTAGRAMTITCSKRWTQPLQREFAQAMKETGADLYIPYFPDWGGSADAERLAECIRELGGIMPVMILSALEGRGTPLSVFDQLTEKDGVVAVKDDTPMPYGMELGYRIREKFAFLSGGTASMFLEEAPYGADGYLSVYARCFPEVSEKFWKAYTGKSIKDAASIVEKYELPLLRIWDKMHFDAVNHALQEIAGVGTRYRRSPYSELTEEQMEELRSMLKGANVI